ncbi:MAG: Hsp20/alpha crystallin family protein [Pseudomonadota bacterium]|nr:Hsp20/alpha crystallin family protein [Pseudomonadota bacterium]
METNQDILKREAPGAEAAALIPPVDVIEDEAGITVIADLAGVAKEDLAIRVDGDTLTIEAPISLGESQNIDPVYAEIRAAQYKRSFTLSRELDIAKIDAALKDGVLKLYVPKVEQAKPRRIEVKLG